MSNFRRLCLCCTLVRRQRARVHTPRWMLCGGLLVTWHTIRHLPSTTENIFSACLFDGSAVICPVEAPARRSWARPGPSAFQPLSWQTGSSYHPTAISIDDSSEPWLDQTSNYWPLEEHHYANVFAVSASFKTDDTPFWNGLLLPSTRGDTLRENRRLFLNCHEDNHPFKHCRHPFM